jgi:hypothetical protein
MKAPSAGYSRTPLAKKIGMLPNCRVVAKYAPADYAQLLEPIPENVRFQKVVSHTIDIVHIFATHKAVLNAELKTLRHLIRPDCAVWISWPKKTSNIPGDITEQTIRDLALPLGFVDIKVCAVNDVWSGLKLVVRKELR